MIHRVCVRIGEIGDRFVRVFDVRKHQQKKSSSVCVRIGKIGDQFVRVFDSTYICPCSVTGCLLWDTELLSASEESSSWPLFELTLEIAS